MPRTGRDRFNKVMGALHARLFRSSKGRVGKSMQGAPMLLLNTTGAKSGEARTSPLIYLADGDDFIVVASNAGQDHAPGWYHNLLADPSGSVEIGGVTTKVRAEVVPEADKAALWPRLDAIFNGYAKYRSRTTREIPLLRLRKATA
jgi:deazaflavin-dependent oxidoreductase (nitroreductase family)